MLELYVGLTNYCNAQESFDRGMFAVMLDTYTSGYKRLDYQEQGELAEDIRKYYKEYEWRTEMATEVSKKVMEELLDLSAGAEEVETGLTDLLVKQDLNRKVEALNTIYNRWLKLRGEIKKAERPDQVFVDKDGKETSTHSKKAFDGLKALRVPPFLFGRRCCPAVAKSVVAVPRALCCGRLKRHKLAPG